MKLKLSVILSGIGYSMALVSTIINFEWWKLLITIICASIMGFNLLIWKLNHDNKGGLTVEVRT